MNLLTFDIEDWYHTNFPAVDFTVFDQREDHEALFEKIRQLTALCREEGLQGTFFVLGRLLEKRPELGEWIVDQGHELALHGYEHDLLTQKTPDQFQWELERSLKIFRQITGAVPLGFRAPSWSVNGTNLWVLEVLEAFGFAYDSSLFPVKNFLYGFREAPSVPFFPQIAATPLRLLEIPVPVVRLGPLRLAFSGGIFFNVWPFGIVRRLVRQYTQKGRPCLFYFHPWDLWKRTGEQTRQLKARWINLHWGDTLIKFNKLLKTYPLGSVASGLEHLRETAVAVRIGGH
ncbi:MAG: polysaccharide deacetylase family protein [Thermodesulfobacteriota bacterium]